KQLSVESTDLMADFLRRAFHRDPATQAPATTSVSSHAIEDATPQSETENMQPSQDADPEKKKEASAVNEEETIRTDSIDTSMPTTEKPGTKPEDTTATTTEANVEDIAEVEDESNTTYLRGMKLALVTFGLLLANFVVALDNTIIATAIPKITTIFDSLNDVGWYGSAYLLTTTSLQPSFGKIYTYFDVKWVYISALLIFELGSILCAAATSSMMLIIGRAVAGVGAAALFSGAMTIIGYSVPLRNRAVYMSILASMFGIASVVGPILGGAFADRVSWRWCFWINLPFGGITVAVIFFFFSNPPRPYADMPTKEKFKHIDFSGAFVLISAIVCLLLALQWGGSVKKWSIWLKDRATMPPHIFRGQRTVTASALFNCFLGMALYAIIYYTPFYFQAIKNTTAEESGIRCIPFLVSVTISAVLSGASITILGPLNPVMWIGSAIFVVGAGMLYTLQPDSGPGMWIGYQVLAGFGAGMCVQVPFVAVQVALSEKDMPIGNAITIFSNTLGGAISVSIAQNRLVMQIFSNTLIQELPKLAPSVDPRLVIGAGATHIRQVVSADVLPAVLEAYNRAIVRTYIMAVAVGAIAFLSSFLMEWRSVKGKKIQMAAVA
ncbi:MFS-type efflux pump MFS1, partial [Pseudocercospora fuligena]